MATVQGQVLDFAGTPLVGDSVAITCAGSADRMTTPIGASGCYGANLGTSESAIGGANSRAACVFSVGAPATTRIHATARIGFTTANVPHAIQRVDLRETFSVTAPRVANPPFRAPESETRVLLTAHM